MPKHVHRVETGKQLARWRARRGWTQYQAAIWYGISEDTWKRLEKRPNLPLPLRQRIAELNWQERLLKVATPPLA